MIEKCGNGAVTIQWMGQMGLMIKAGDKTICIDYYASPNDIRQTPAPIPPEELKEIDAFIGTHDHLDHIDHEAWKIWAKNNPKAKFIFPKAHLDLILADGVVKENAIGLNAGQSYEIGGFTIHAIAASHEFLDMDQKTGLYPYLQYVIEYSGVRIHHAGDTIRYEGMLKRVKDFGDIDVALLPINGRDAKRYRRNCIGNMTYQEAADFAGDCGTRIVIPGHWDMFADNGGDPAAFADYIDVKYKGRLKCIIPDVMEAIEIQN